MRWQPLSISLPAYAGISLPPFCLDGPVYLRGGGFSAVLPRPAPASLRGAEPEGPDGPGPCGRLSNPAASGSSTASGSLWSPVRNAPEPAAIPPARQPRGHTLRCASRPVPPADSWHATQNPTHNPAAARLPAPQASRTSPALTALPTQHVLPRPNGGNRTYISINGCSI